MMFHHLHSPSCNCTKVTMSMDMVPTTYLFIHMSLFLICTVCVLIGLCTVSWYWYIMKCYPYKVEQEFLFCNLLDILVLRSHKNKPHIKELKMSNILICRLIQSRLLCWKTHVLLFCSYVRERENNWIRYRFISLAVFFHIEKLINISPLAEVTCEVVAFKKSGLSI